MDPAARVLVALTRGASGRDIEALADHWARGRSSHRSWYLDALTTWAKDVSQSPHTARIYASAVGSFFAWAHDRGRGAPPSLVRTSDVEAWVAFLASGDRTLPLDLSPDEREVWASVTARRGGDVRVADVAAALAPPSFLERDTRAERAQAALGALVRRKLLVGSPRRHGLVTTRPETYRLAPPRPPVSPQTLAQRLYALQSFFLTLIGDGGKRAGFVDDGPFAAAPVSPVTPVLHRINRTVLASRTVRSDARKTRRADWADLRLACWSRDVPERQARRDWTILVCLATMGLRVSELCALRVGDVEPEGDARFVVVRRKGGTLDRVRIPLIAWMEIERLHELGTAAALPLACVAVHRWGNQADIPPEVPLSTSQVQEIFRDLADVVAASTGRPPAEVHGRLHAHGLRHLYAQMLAEAGTPLHEIRNLLGHANIATTDAYLARAAGKDTDHSAVFAGLTTRA